MAANARARTIAVIGNGIIGHGIAEIFAVGGWRVRLIGPPLTSYFANSSLRISPTNLPTRKRQSARLSVTIR